MYDPNMNQDDDFPSVSIIIPAAGESTRMETTKRKPWLELGGMPIIHRTLHIFCQIHWVDEIILVVNPEDEDDVNGALWPQLSQLGVTLAVAGGKNRAESVWNALQVCDPMAEVVAVHDAVRPFISADTCKAIFRTARDRGACIPAVPLHDTIKRVEGDQVQETISRFGVMAVQTPQAFRRELLIEAFEYAMKTGELDENITDDASLVEKYGHKVSVVLGSSANIKITTKEDLLLAQAMLKSGI